MRLFLATRLDDDVGECLRAGFARARRDAARASWVRSDAYHLTWAFLGEKDEGTSKTIGEALPGSVSETPAYEGALVGGGFFPNARRPKVGWLSFENPEALSVIGEAVRQMLDRLGVSYDRKPFRPHLTVVRIRDRWSERDVQAYDEAVAAIGRVQVSVNRVCLFRSQLHPDGARHDELAGAALRS